MGRRSVRSVWWIAGAFAAGFGCGGGGSGGSGGNGAGGTGAAGAHGGAGGGAGHLGSGGAGGQSGGAGSSGAGGQVGSGGASTGGQSGSGPGGASTGGQSGSGPGGASSGGAAGGSGGGGGRAGSGGAGGAAGAGGGAGNAGGGAGGTAGGAGHGGAGAGGHAGGGAGGSSAGAGGDVTVTGAGGFDGGTCQATNVTFAQRAPTVFILVDQGGDEFDTATTGAFFQIRTAVEAVVAAYAPQIRLGFGSYVGDHASGVCQLDFASVPIAADNAAVIKALYDSLGPLQPFGVRADKPAVEALPMVRQALVADTGGGAPYLLFVSNGNTDFCDDGDSVCSADAMTFLIQSLYLGAPSVGTLVVGVPNDLATGATPSAAILQNLANAGAGQPSVVPGTTTADDVYDQCTGMTDGGAESWQSLYVASGRSGVTPLAIYATQAGTAPLYMAASTSAADIQTALAAALSSAKSCTFDVRQGHIDLSKLGEVSVSIDGNPVPLDATNGWQMPSSTELDLAGTACAALRAGGDIAFHFPCDVVTP